MKGTTVFSRMKSPKKVNGGTYLRILQKEMRMQEFFKGRRIQ